MLQFLQPIWLWASAGIIVPVIIHLLNVKQGKTRKVGSIFLFSESAASHARRRKLSDRLLLMLRCLLIILLSVLIAKPVWKSEAKANEHGWILIEKNAVKQAYKSYKPLIDTLLKNGYSFHYFNSGFTEEIFKNALQKNIDTTSKLSLPYWTLLKELTDKLPSRLPVYLFTNQQLQRFGDARPAISFPLTWLTYNDIDTSISWLEKAYQTIDDSIRIVTGISNRYGTNYTVQSISSNQSNAEYQLKNKNGTPFIIHKNAKHKQVLLDTSSTTIVLYANAFVEDANYVMAAINAIKDVTKFNIKISLINDVKKIPDQYDWLFWLSEDTLPVSLIKRHVFMYEKGKSVSVSSALITGNITSVSPTDDLYIYQAIKDSTSAKFYQTIWKNSFDEPVLSLEKSKASLYHFYNRFNPQWSNLVWQPVFPQMIYKLLFSKSDIKDSASTNDKRIIDSSQILPAFFVDQNHNVKQHKFEAKDISNAIWLLAFILFVIERIISFRTKDETA